MSADSLHWMVIGASPDLRQQIIQTSILWPFAHEAVALEAGRRSRHSPIASVVLLNADVDAIAGLLVLREGWPFEIYAPEPILDVLSANPIFNVLDPALVRRISVTPEQAVACGHGLTLTLLPMPGKTPLYLEDRTAAAAEPGPTYAALVQGEERRVLIAPACAEITPSVLALLRQADVVFFDGTLFADDEMIAAGLGHKTGRRMGHVSMSGELGSLAQLADLSARRIFIHINNTNPVLIEDSPERRAVEAAGFEIAYDGMEVRL